MAGRKETWKKDLKENAIKIILNRIAEGESVREILSKDRDQSVLPSRKLFYEWVANDKSLSEQEMKVREKGGGKKWIRYQPNKYGSVAVEIDDYRRLNARHANKKRGIESFFYIAQLEGSNMYKLGVSSNVKRRIKDIKSPIPFEVTCIYEIKLVDPYDFEEKIHFMYKENFINREWFELSTTQILTIQNISKLWQEERSTGQKKERRKP